MESSFEPVRRLAIDVEAAARAAREVCGRSDGATMPAELVDVLAAARGAAASAHAPYSGLSVGAALLAGDGRIVVGCNVESASFGLTQCAERAALATARVAGVEDVLLVLVASSAGRIPPCGACRQVLSELAPGAVVLAADASESVGASASVRGWTVAELLPDAFDGRGLPRGAR